jgi:hypothetical protein
MQFALISIAIIIVSSTANALPAGGGCNEPTTTERARPLQQFFKKVLNALKPTTTLAPKRNKTDWVAVASSLHTTQLQTQEIPNFVDFSSYLLNSFAANNTAIKFSYMQPNETFAPSLRGNYSVISFLVPHNDENIKSDNTTKGIFSFLSNLRLPWNRAPQMPSDTDISKFPPLLEYFTQRIQAYFSIYKYTDDSRINNTVVIFAPGPEDFPETSVRDQNDEVIDTTETLEFEETTESLEVDSSTKAFKSSDKVKYNQDFESIEKTQTNQGFESTETAQTNQALESTEKTQTNQVLENTEKAQTNKAFESTEKAQINQGFDSTETAQTNQALESTEKTRTNQVLENTEKAQSNQGFESTETAQINQTLENTKKAQTDQAFESTERTQNINILKTTKVVNSVIKIYSNEI